MRWRTNGADAQQGEMDEQVMTLPVRMGALGLLSNAEYARHAYYGGSGIGCGDGEDTGRDELGEE